MTLSSTKKNWIKWAVAVTLLLLIGAGVLRSLTTRKAQQQALAARAAANDGGLVELAATDVLTVRTLQVTQGLPVSGSLRAVTSAVIKARVAGELQGLTLREGDVVKAGQVVARIDATEYQARVRQAREQGASAKAQVEVVQRQYDNNKALVDQGFISKTALDTSLANLNAAQSTYKAAVAATEVAAKSVDDTVLKAPISGQVSQRLAQPGERVGIDAKIIEIVDLSRLELEASLSATDSMSVNLGQTAELQIEGSPQLVKATVVRINPSAQAGSRSVLAYLSIDNAGSATLPLRQGLFAQGTLGTVRAPLLAVPLSSVRTDKPAPYVQAIQNGAVAHIPVELGVRGSAGQETVVAVRGIAEGTQLLGSGIGSIREGTKVKFTQLSTASDKPAAAAALPVSSQP